MRLIEIVVDFLKGECYLAPGDLMSVNSRPSRQWVATCCSIFSSSSGSVNGFFGFGASIAEAVIVVCLLSRMSCLAGCFPPRPAKSCLSLSTCAETMRVTGNDSQLKCGSWWGSKSGCTESNITLVRLAEVAANLYRCQNDQQLITGL